VAELNTSQQFANVGLTILDGRGNPASVDGAPVWASSDETVVSVVAAPDGMSAVVSSVAPGGPARIAVTADADLGEGVVSITGFSEDITVVADPLSAASVLTLNLGDPTDK
jgi:hypothetical protein